MAASTSGGREHLPEPATQAAPAGEDLRVGLRADCERCFGLCCVAPAFFASADFAITKEAGRPCPNLRRSDSQCRIHDRLRQQGFAGCSAYDCFGAGQHVAQVTFGGVSWQASQDVAAGMFAVFGVMRHVHELMWYVVEALALSPARALHGELRRAFEETVTLSRLGPETLLNVDISEFRGNVDSLLVRTSELVRAGVRREGTYSKGFDRTATDSGLTGSARGGSGRRTDFRGADLRGADLAGRKLCGADLTGANLRSACLIGADLTGADLSRTDLIGADLRAADLSRADLTTSIFLTQFQANAARGDGGTGLPASLNRPAHWLL